MSYMHAHVRKQGLSRWARPVKYFPCKHEELSLIPMSQCYPKYLSTLSQCWLRGKVKRSLRLAGQAPELA